MRWFNKVRNYIILSFFLSPSFLFGEFFLGAHKHGPHTDDLAIHHLPHIQLRWNFFEKIRNIFLHYLVALSSCNKKFEGEKWELSQLEYSGEMQLLQKEFNMEKHMWMLFGQIKHSQNTGRHTSHQYWPRMYNFWEFSIIKHIWAIFRFVINDKHSGSQNSTYFKH